jgi:flagellar motor protein MotB
MSELQKSCLEAHSNDNNSLHDWFKDVVKSMQEVEIKRTQERSKLYISDTPMFLDAAGIISSYVHSENLDLKWLTKLKVQIDSPILEKLKSDSELEKENKKLKKDLLEHKLEFAEYKRQTEAQLEEARLREANLIRSNNEFKEEMKKQSETTNMMLKEIMDMFQKQAKP